MKIIVVTLIILFTMFIINKIKNYSNNKIFLRKDLNEDLSLFNQTRNMSWENVCLIINSKYNNLEKRELTKNKILFLREKTK